LAWNAEQVRRCAVREYHATLLVKQHDSVWQALYDCATGGSGKDRA
jgi:hypothetical protein